jgi:hypothetical protein
MVEPSYSNQAPTLGGALGLVQGKKFEGGDLLKDVAR